MKSYKKKNLLLFSFSIVFVLTIVFFCLLNTIKLWTYYEVNLLNVNNNSITVFTTLDLKKFKDNNFFYYDTLKYNFKIESKETYKDGFILILELEKSLKLLNDDMIIILPNTKKNIFSLIIESWRVK